MLKCSQVPFIGHLLTSEGLKPVPQKVQAICNMPKPEDVQGVQRFVNTVKYLSRFLEDLSDMSEPLRRLTHKDVPWEWSQEQEEGRRRRRLRERNWLRAHATRSTRNLC